MSLTSLVRTKKGNMLNTHAFSAFHPEAHGFWFAFCVVSRQGYAASDAERQIHWLLAYEAGVVSCFSKGLVAGTSAENGLKTSELSCFHVEFAVAQPLGLFSASL